jgi:opacity protein-like surface antigen
MRILSCFATLAALALSAPASAADVASEEPEVAKALGHEWQFQATLYGWLTAVNGDVGIRGIPPVNVDVTVGDLLDNIDKLDGAFMGSLYGTDGTWMFLTDLIWARVEDDVTLGPAGGIVNFEESQVIASAIVGHALPLDIPDLQLSATAGVRYNHVKAELDIDPVLLPRLFPGSEREGSQDWADPIIGLSAHYDIDDKWFVNALADIGGFGVGSKLTAQGFIAVGYNWTDTVSTAIGYRAIYTNYENDGFVYDTTMHGVFSSVGIHF